MVSRIGMLGLSEGNGHPFSFSAIINGYDDAAFAAAGWPVIHGYLRRQPPEAFGLGDVRVTAAWTQDAGVTARLCAACGIEHAAGSPDEMLDSVDAAIVARDDWQSHAGLALPFLRRGIPVFVDKPLTLDEAELDAFAPHLESGLLFSSAGLRYARELDEVRDRSRDIGDVKLVAATVLNELERYGIHMIEAVAGLGIGRPVRVTRLEAPHESFAIAFGGGAMLQLNCLGAVARTFHLSVFGTRGQAHVDLHDNFSAFRRLLQAFVAMVETRRPPLDPAETIGVIRAIMAARRLRPGESAPLQ